MKKYWDHVIHIFTKNKIKLWVREDFLIWQLHWQNASIYSKSLLVVQFWITFHFFMFNFKAVFIQSIKRKFLVKTISNILYNWNNIWFFFKNCFNVNLFFLDNHTTLFGKFTHFLKTRKPWKSWPEVMKHLTCIYTVYSDV